MSLANQSPISQEARRGVLAGGNFITDYVKIISDWPAQDALASIRSESMSNGGGPYNLLKDLAALDRDLPLEAVGRVGEDANGEWILQDCQDAGISVSQLRKIEAAPTSYTDAMTVEGCGRRTFFHQHGANALLGPDDFDFTETRSRIFYLGFIMLLKSLDKIDGEGRSGASRVLEAAGKAGLITAADMVTATDPSFRAVALSALPYLDILFLNELEAGRILKREVDSRVASLRTAATDLLGYGVRQMVVIHSANGAVAMGRDGESFAQGRVNMPSGEVLGTTGAGDAFAAGFLLGWHEELDVARCLQQAVCVAACSLTAASASAGVKTLGDCLALGDRHGFVRFQDELISV